jgi:DNA-binding SARP family transcriptional activator
MDDGSRQTVEIRFLGAFSVTVGGTPVRRWRAGKARGLFQYLVLHRGQILTRERLYEALWPDAPWSAGRSSLKVAAHALRRILGAHPQDPGEGGIRLEYRDFGYVLQVDDLWSDVDRFQALVQEGLREGEGALGRLRDALALYGGEFLQGETADWVVEQREYLKALALRALGVLRTDAAARDDFPGLIDLCRRTLEIDRHHEEAYRALMAAHGSRGELAQARRWYELCAGRLRRDLGVEPAPETEQLLRALLPGAAPAAPAPAPAAPAPATPVRAGARPRLAPDPSPRRPAVAARRTSPVRIAS